MAAGDKLFVGILADSGRVRPEFSNLEQARQVVQTTFWSRQNGCFRHFGATCQALTILTRFSLKLSLFSVLPPLFSDALIPRYA
jgi:hypothetical protein